MAAREAHRRLEPVDGVGAVTENDVLLASTSSALIVAFNVGIGAKARQAKQKARINAYNELAGQSERERINRAQIVIPNGPRLGGKVIEVTVDGNDLLAVYDTVGQAVHRARAGEGPSLIENLTYRWRGHSV